MLTTTSLAGAGTGTLTFWSIMNMTKLKLGFGALVLAGASTALIVQHQARGKLLLANESLAQQIAQLKADNESLSNLAAQAKPPASPPGDQLDELLRLRGEVGMLRHRPMSLPDCGGRIGNCWHKLWHNPSPPIKCPRKTNSHSDRRIAVDAMTTLLNAIKNYATNHNGQYPGTLDQLAASGDLGATNLAGNLDWKILNLRKTARWTRKAARSFSASGFPFNGLGNLGDRTARETLGDSFGRNKR